MVFPQKSKRVHLKTAETRLQHFGATHKVFGISQVLKRVRLKRAQAQAGFADTRQASLLGRKYKRKSGNIPAQLKTQPKRHHQSKTGTPLGRHQNSARR